MLASLMVLGQTSTGIPLEFAVIGLGIFNGMFAVAAIGSMMSLAGDGKKAREGTRMGLWGAAQAVAAGFGGLFGAAAVDMLRVVLTTDAAAFGAVFIFEGALFLAAALMAARVIDAAHPALSTAAIPGE